jgi:hypothetical protein
MQIAGAIIPNRLSLPEHLSKGNKKLPALHINLPQGLVKIQFNIHKTPGQANGRFVFIPIFNTRM